MKIPRKKELLELQKKYRTDKKIGEVYGVPGRLVAYWRSKKKIGSYNMPKYSRERIIDLWERFGDDRLAGTELGISGAGFRRWRIQYAIKNKPAQLKMEQLELDFAELPKKNKNSRKETFIRKLLAKKSGLKSVDEGEVVTVTPDLAIAIDNAGPIIDRFFEEGYTKVIDQSKIAIILNKLLIPDSDNTAEEHKKIRQFARKQGIMNFYDLGWGISHQVIIDEGLILPGQMAVGTDHHTAAYGSIGAFSANISSEDMVKVWISGKTIIQVPKTIKTMIHGNPAKGVFTSDIILKLSSEIKKTSAQNKTFEFCGSTVSAMSISQRITLTNFAVDAGAQTATTPFDDITQRFLKKITKAKYKPIYADNDATYENEIEFDASYLTPQVAFYDEYETVKPVEELRGKRINHIVLGGCTNGRLEDLQIAALILRGRRIHRNIRMFVVPASRKTYLDAVDKGYIHALVESGCLMLSPSHCSCISANTNMLADGETALTTTCRIPFNSNKSKNSFTYVASPATVAASALEGAITDPRKYLL